MTQAQIIHQGRVETGRHAGGREYHGTTSRGDSTEVILSPHLEAFWEQPALRVLRSPGSVADHSRTHQMLCSLAGHLKQAGLDSKHFSGHPLDGPTAIELPSEDPHQQDEIVGWLCRTPEGGIAIVEFESVGEEEAAPPFAMRLRPDTAEEQASEAATLMLRELQRMLQSP